MSTRAERLIERDDELRALEAALAAARDGNGALLLVEGSAGMGKTALLDAADAAAGEGMDRLRARATELERDHAFGVVRQLVEPRLRRLDDERRDALLSGAAAHAAPVLGFGKPAASSSGFAVLYGLYWLFVDLASECPLVLLIDDAHWADEPSMTFIAFLAPRLSSLRLAVVVAARDDEQGPQSSLIDEVRSDPISSSVSPAPLSQAGVMRLLREELGVAAEHDFAEACRTATRGNPFYLRALAGELRSSGIPPRDAESGVVASLAPDGIARAVRARLSRAAGPGFDVARAVAVLGDGAPLRHVAGLAQMGVDAAAAAAEELVGMAILAAYGDGVSFAHPIVRTSVYEGIGQRTRAMLHAGAARLLVADDAEPEAVATHLLHADPAADPSVVERLRVAARCAQASGAPVIAVRFLRRALEEPPADEREHVLHELGMAEASARSPAASEHLRGALAISEDPRRRAQIVLLLANELGFIGEATSAADLLEAAIDDLAGSDGDRDLVLTLEAMLAAVGRISAVTAVRNRGRLARLEPSLRGGGPGVRRVLANLSFEEVAVGTSKPALELAERALGSGELLAQVGADDMSFHYASGTLCYCDRYDAATRHWQEALADARRTGSALGFALASSFLALASYRQGLLAEAEADACAAMEAFAGGDRSLLTLVESILADAQIERGALDEAEATLALTPPAADAEGMMFLVWPLHARARLRSAQGRLPEALDDVLACGRTAQASSVRSATMLAWRSSAALIHLALGDREPARGLVDDELELARGFGAPRAIGVALLTSAVVEGGDLGVALLEQAEEVLGACGARLEQARALVARGSALRRANRRVDAREPLRAGLELAHRCGARVLERHAHIELKATGARPRGVVHSGVDALTPSELRVARMAADGSSNRSIAQALFVTPKTVETHLSRVYAKLGMSSRADLPQALTAA